MTTLSDIGTAEGTRRALTVLPEYLRLLVARLATHGTGETPCRCRCGGLRPCAEEHRVAELVDIAGTACRSAAPTHCSGIAVAGASESGPSPEPFPRGGL